MFIPSRLRRAHRSLRLPCRRYGQRPEARPTIAARPIRPNTRPSAETSAARRQRRSPCRYSTPGSQRWNRPAWPNMATIRFRSVLAKASRWSSQTSQSWTSPKSVCTFSIASTAASSRPGWTARAISKVYRSRLAAMRMAWWRSRSSVLARLSWCSRSFVQLAEHVLRNPLERLGSLRAGKRAGTWHSRLRLGGIGWHTRGRRRRNKLREGFLGHPPHLLQDAFGFQTMDRLDDFALQPLAVPLQLHQHAGNARKTLRGVERRQRAAEHFDLHVAVAGVAQGRGDPPDRVAPASDPFVGETAVEHPQGRPQVAAWPPAARWTNSISSAARTPSNCSASCLACRRM